MNTLTLTVIEADSRDVGRGAARLDPADLRSLGARAGDILRLQASRETFVRALPAAPEQRGQSVILLDSAARKNAGVSLGDTLIVTHLSTISAAQAIALEAVDGEPLPPHLLRRQWVNKPAAVGDTLRIARIGAAPQHYRIAQTQPEGPVLITEATHISVIAAATGPARPALPSYEDIGGLDREIQRIREMIELPMRFPQVFRHLGVTPPKGVLLHGPPGSGKTLIARALAQETNAYFAVINGPEIMDKFYGQSEGALRAVFEEAQRNAPAIVFIDEIDAIAPPRDQVQGEVEKRVVAQLLTLMDGLQDRGDVVVIGATNLRDRIDPALRRPGRFDREITLRVPDKAGREAILNVHTRGMPLAADVNLQAIAAGTHGYVGADLAALCREAAMAALRRFLNDDSLDGVSMTDLLSLTVMGEDFAQAQREIIPSTTRGVIVEIPEVGWDEIGGLHAAKTALQQAIELPLAYPELFAMADLKPPRGVLLSGPPGTGKTLLAKAAANALQVNFISVRGPEVMSRWVGDSERQIRELFRTARMASPCVIFFDEFDAIAPIRTGSDPVAERIVAQLLVEMDGLEDGGGVIVLAATNRPDLIDPALRRSGRLDLHFEVGMPDEAARRGIFAVHLRGKPLDPAVDFEALVQVSEGWSGADIAEFCRRAALQAVVRAIETGGALCLTPGDFEEMIGTSL